MSDYEPASSVDLDEMQLRVKVGRQMFTSMDRACREQSDMMATL